MAHARLPFRKAPRRDSRYRYPYQPARRAPVPATCNEPFPGSTPGWSQPVTPLLLPPYRHSANFLFRQLRNPEVEHFHVPVRPQHDVLRLDVAVDNAGFVGGGERTRHLDRDVDGFTQLHSPARQTLTQRLAFDQFTGNVVS